MYQPTARHDTSAPLSMMASQYANPMYNQRRPNWFRDRQTMPPNAMPPGGTNAGGKPWFGGPPQREGGPLTRPYDGPRVNHRLPWFGGPPLPQPQPGSEIGASAPPWYGGPPVPQPPGPEAKPPWFGGPPIPQPAPNATKPPWYGGPPQRQPPWFGGPPVPQPNITGTQDPRQQMMLQMLFGGG
jgi:hypothetical protein